MCAEIQEQRSDLIREKHKSEGVIFVSFGIRYLLQALHSIETLRQYNQALPAIIVTNVQREIITPSQTTLKRVSAKDSENRIYKTSANRYSPFERTIFVDCDTEFRADPAIGFSFLERAHLAVRPEPPPYSMSVSEKKQEEALDLMQRYGEFNTGAMIFDSSKIVTEFFTLWNQFTLENPTRDQKHFLRAIDNFPPLAIWPLGAAWNYTRYDLDVHPKTRQLKKQPYILHYGKYPYAWSALAGVRKQARINNIEEEVSGTRFFLKEVIRPALERWTPTFIKVSDKIRSSLWRNR